MHVRSEWPIVIGGDPLVEEQLPVEVEVARPRGRFGAPSTSRACDLDVDVLHEPVGDPDRAGRGQRPGACAEPRQRAERRCRREQRDPADHEPHPRDATVKPDVLPSSAHSSSARRTARRIPRSRDTPVSRLAACAGTSRTLYNFEPPTTARRDPRRRAPVRPQGERDDEALARERGGVRARRRGRRARDRAAPRRARDDRARRATARSRPSGAAPATRARFALADIETKPVASPGCRVTRSTALWLLPSTVVSVPSGFTDSTIADVAGAEEDQVAGGRRRVGGQEAAGRRGPVVISETEPSPCPASPSGVPACAAAHEAKYAHHGRARPGRPRPRRGRPRARGRRSTPAAAPPAPIWLSAAARTADPRPAGGRLAGRRRGRRHQRAREAALGAAAGARVAAGGDR